MAKSTAKTAETQTQNEFASPYAVYSVSKKLAYMFVAENGIAKYHYKKLVSRFNASLLAKYDAKVPQAKLDKLFKIKNLNSREIKPVLSNLKITGLGLPETQVRGKETRVSKGSQEPSGKPSKVVLS